MKAATIISLLSVAGLVAAAPVHNGAAGGNVARAEPPSSGETTDGSIGGLACGLGGAVDEAVDGAGKAASGLVDYLVDPVGDKPRPGDDRYYEEQPGPNLLEGLPAGFDADKLWESINGADGAAGAGATGGDGGAAAGGGGAAADGS